MNHLTARLALALTLAAPPALAGPAPAVVTAPGGLEMVRIPAGRFVMGDAAGAPDERPPRAVEVSAFLMDRREVTQALFDRIMGYNPAKRERPGDAVDQIRWTEAIEFCNERSKREGLAPCYDLKTGACRLDADGYRLPTEAEWEYACRAGTTTRTFCGDAPGALAAHAWFAGNASKTSRPVGAKKPNPWGLFDMAGSLLEWCNDRYAADAYAAGAAKDPTGPATGRDRVLRGGSWNMPAAKCRSAIRFHDEPASADSCYGWDSYGFRCVRRAAAPARKEKQAMPAAPLPTGFVYDPVYLEHKTGPGFPERPGRLEAIVKRLRDAGLEAKLTAIRPLPSPREWIEKVHTPAYVERVRKAAAACGDGIDHLDSGDCPISAKSFDAAVAAVGGVLAAVDAVMAGKVRNAFCAVRPPGHHALKERAMGFCLFNNVAVAARYLQQKHKLARILIADWDVHHGNGTQAAFYEDPTVFYFSTHQFPFYPGSGAATERGAGKGAGATLNVPLRAGAGDAEIRKAFETLRAAARDFRPDFVLVSAGFDAHADDPLADLAVTETGFAALTRTMREIAGTHCDGRLVSMLEGGYHLEALADSVEAHLRVLMEAGAAGRR
jgi:acetoin utilization deacetylase AcuC-like enzyme/formylglycine-generating enzyme required for sulfatase activity